MNYRDDGARPDTDRILASVKYERYSARPRQSAFMAPHRGSVEALATALASWERSAPAVLAVLAKARVQLPVVDQAVFAAFRYVSHIIVKVADLLSATLELRDHVTVEDTVTDELVYQVGSTPSGPSSTGLTYDLTSNGADRTLGGQGDDLHVLKYAAATIELRIDRNAALLEQGNPAPVWPSATRFIYTTDRIGSGDWKRPRLEPAMLFTSAPVDVKGPKRQSGIETALKAWLEDLATDAVDLEITSSYVFDCTGRSITTFAHLSDATMIPLRHLVGTVVGVDGVSPAKLASELAIEIDRTLPPMVQAAQGGVLAAVTAFSHGASSASGAGEFPVLQLRLWIPFA